MGDIANWQTADYVPRQQRSGPAVVCSYCGITHVYWRNVGGQWRLWECGVEHSCPATASVKCRHCGTSGLTRSETDSGWRLHTHAGGVHTCSGYTK